MHTRKLLTLVTGLLAAINLYAQDVPNHSFEKWVNYNGSEYLVPQHWITNDILTRRFNINYNGVSVSRLEEPHTGDYALKMEVVVDNGDTVNGGIYSTGSLDSLMHVIYRRKNAGFSCKQRAATFTGYYIFTSNQNDSAVMGVTFTKWNSQNHKRDTLVNTTLHIGQNASSYLQFVIPLKYHIDTEIPDSAFIAIGIQGPYGHPAHRGTMLIIDDLGFSGNIPMKKE
jgi:hypothetical protein